MNVLPTNRPCFSLNYDIGWIGFIHHHSLIADGINWFTRWWRHGNPAVSHVFVVTGPGSCVEANSDGVDQDPIGYFDDPTYTTYLRQPLGWTPDLGRRIADQAIAYAGFKYDFPLIAADLVSNSLLGHLLNDLTGDELDNALTALASDPKKMICDKLAVLAMQAQPELAGKGTLVLPARRNNPQMLFGDDAIFNPRTSCFLRQSAVG